MVVFLTAFWLLLLPPQVGLLLVGSVVLFVGIIVLETVRAVRFARRINYVVKKRRSEGAQHRRSGAAEAGACPCLVSR